MRMTPDSRLPPQGRAGLRIQTVLPALARYKSCLKTSVCVSLLMVLQLFTHRSASSERSFKIEDIFGCQGRHLRTSTDIYDLITVI